MAFELKLRVTTSSTEDYEVDIASDQSEMPKERA
jgi:hypothetical protein